MTDIQIAGMLLLAVVAVCSTIVAKDILNRKIEEQHRKDAERRERSRNRDKRFHDRNETLYLVTKAKLDEQIVRNGILEEQLRRARETMAKVRIADVGKDGKDE